MEEDVTLLADLTTSEGQLGRYTEICHLLAERYGQSSQMLIAGIRAKIGLTNEKVIRRHLRVLETLGLADKEVGMFSCSSEGFALRQLSSSTSHRLLSTAEKIVYLRSLTRHVPFQLAAVLAAIRDQSDAGKPAVVLSYDKWLFHRDAGRQGLGGPRPSLRDNPRVPRKLENNFDCLVLWLRQLGFVESSGLHLTHSGHQIANAMDVHIERVREMAFYLASTCVCGAPGCLPRLNLELRDHWTPFLAILKEAYHLFEIPLLGLADAIAMRLYLCVRLMVDRRLLLDELHFDHAVAELARRRVVSSAMTGRKGRLAYISLGPSAQ